MIIVVLAPLVICAFVLGVAYGRSNRKENREVKELRAKMMDLRVLAAEHSAIDHFAVIVLDHLKEGK